MFVKSAMNFGEALCPQVCPVKRRQNSAHTTQVESLRVIVRPNIDTKHDRAKVPPYNGSDPRPSLEV